MDFKQLKILLSTSYTALGALIIVFILAIVGSILIINYYHWYYHQSNIVSTRQ